MRTISLAEAKARLSELVERAAAGDPVSITRRGKAVARLTAADLPRKRIDPKGLCAITDLMPRQTEGASVFVRRMRDDDRY